MGTISRTSNLVYDKIDAKNWLLYPKHSEVERTSFLDVRKLLLFRNSNTLSAVKTIKDEEIEDILKDI